MFSSSKANFLKHRVIPANDNDTFNDNKCPLCWDTYDNEHVPVRILPCNHVFGRECFLQVINTSEENTCVVCRAPLFRPPMRKLVTRFIQLLLQSVMIRVAALEHRLLAIFAALPRWLQVSLMIIWYWFNRNYLHNWVPQAVDHLTDLSSRNQLRLYRALRYITFNRIFFMPYVVARFGTPFYSSRRSEVSGAGSHGVVGTWDGQVLVPILSLLITISTALNAYGIDIYGLVRGSRNRRIVKRAFFAALVFIHLYDVWALLCFMLSRHPLQYSIGKILLYLNYSRFPSN